MYKYNSRRYILPNIVSAKSIKKHDACFHSSGARVSLQLSDGCCLTKLLVRIRCPHRPTIPLFTKVFPKYRSNLALHFADSESRGDVFLHRPITLAYRIADCEVPSFRQE